MVKVFYIIFGILLINNVQAKNLDDCLNFHVINAEPLGYLNANGEIVGAHAETIDKIAEYSGLCINKLLMPYPRIWQGMKYGNHDGGIVFRSESRSKLVDYVAEIRKIKTVAVSLKNVEINEYDDLAKISIANKRKTHLSKRFDSDKNLSIVEVNNYEQAARMLKYRRVDAMVGSVIVIYYQLKKHDALDMVDFSKKFKLGVKEQWLQLSKKSAHYDKIPALRNAIIALKNNGAFDPIMAKYYGEQWQQINQ